MYCGSLTYGGLSAAGTAGLDVWSESMQGGGIGREGGPSSLIHTPTVKLFSLTVNLRRLGSGTPTS